MRKPPGWPGAGVAGLGRWLFCRWGEGVVKGGAQGVGGDASGEGVTSHRGDLLGELFELLAALLLDQHVTPELVEGIISHGAEVHQGCPFGQAGEPGRAVGAGVESAVK